MGTVRRLHSHSRLDLSALALLAPLALSQHDETGLTAWESLKRAMREGVHRDPMDAAAVTLLGGAFLFYVAERNHNPKVRSYWDALIYAATSLSVGYHDIFPKTAAGKAVASVLHTLGPAITNMIFDPPATTVPTPQTAQHMEALLKAQQVIAQKLEELVELTRAREPNR